MGCEGGDSVLCWQWCSDVIFTDVKGEVNREESRDEIIAQTEVCGREME